MALTVRGSLKKKKKNHCAGHSIYLNKGMLLLFETFLRDVFDTGSHRLFLLGCFHRPGPELFPLREGDRREVFGEINQ